FRLTVSVCADSSMYNTVLSGYAGNALPILLFFSLNDPPTPEIYTLSLHDALPICSSVGSANARLLPLAVGLARTTFWPSRTARTDRKSTRLNSSHVKISYAVFCLKKKKHSLTCARSLSQVHETRSDEVARYSSLSH